MFFVAVSVALSFTVSLATVIFKVPNTDFLTVEHRVSLALAFCLSLPKSVAYPDKLSITIDLTSCVGHDLGVNHDLLVALLVSFQLSLTLCVGHDLAKLSNYYGAWEEWGNRDDTPIKTGTRD